MFFRLPPKQSMPHAPCMHRCGFVPTSGYLRVISGTMGADQGGKVVIPSLVLTKLFAHTMRILMIIHSSRIVKVSVKVNSSKCPCLSVKTSMDIKTQVSLSSTSILRIDFQDEVPACKRDFMDPNEQNSI